MLINWETKQLDVISFKKFMPKMQWFKAVKMISNQEQVWYRGEYEDDEVSVLASVRPSMRMQISESFKKRLANGVAPKKGQKESRTNPFVEFGCTATVVIDELFINAVDKLAEPLKKKKSQVMDWS